MGIMCGTLGEDPDLAEINLRTAWEGLPWLHSEFKTLESTFDSKQFVISDQISALITASLSPVNNQIVDIEDIVLEEMTRLNNLLIVCSGGESRSACKALVVQFNLIICRPTFLEEKGSFHSPVFEKNPPPCR